MFHGSQDASMTRGNLETSSLVFLLLYHVLCNGGVDFEGASNSILWNDLEKALLGGYGTTG